MLKFTHNVTTTDGAAAERQVVDMGDVPDDKRAQLESSCANARTHLRANVELEVMDDATFLENLLRSAVGKERANGVDSLHGCLLRPKSSPGSPYTARTSGLPHFGQSTGRTLKGHRALRGRA